MPRIVCNNSIQENFDISIFTNNQVHSFTYEVEGISETPYKRDTINPEENVYINLSEKTYNHRLLSIYVCGLVLIYTIIRVLRIHGSGSLKRANDNYYDEKYKELLNFKNNKQMSVFVKQV